METIFKYLKQPSTWAGLTTILGVLGVTVSPELAAEITTAGVAIIGVIGVLMNQDKDEK